MGDESLEKYEEYVDLKIMMLNLALEQNVTLYDLDIIKEFHKRDVDKMLFDNIIISIERKGKKVKRSQK